MITIPTTRRRHALPPAWARMLATLSGPAWRSEGPERVYVAPVTPKTIRKGDPR